MVTPVKTNHGVNLSGVPLSVNGSPNLAQPQQACLDFPPQVRVRTAAQYKTVFDSRLRVAHPLLNLYWCQTDAPARLGLIVSRKVDKRAVGRNRIKRVLREAMRHVRRGLRNGDYVFLARPDAKTAKNKQIQAAVIQLLRRSGALPLDMTSSPAGSLPLN